ncbi:SH3 domain-containing protein [uncultured Anaerococcus sp.]|uniref:SH3 domain-containing protein n=1 Tax=uncultured Anaerococcus sp. TaxID=293428 RepID=UPI0026120B5E|nr:SH3 domain-containing protein [uncultured Anaerococcus sp.]
MNKKFKIIAVLSLILATSACTDDDYVSVRHPDGEVKEVTDSALEETAGDNPQQAEEANQGTDENASEQGEGSSEDTENNGDSQGDGVMYTVEGQVNVRVAPNENSNVMTTVEPGDEILKLGDSDDWARITIDGQTGYIRSDLLKAK